jgi:hypothetical protein
MCHNNARRGGIAIRDLPRFGASSSKWLPAFDLSVLVGPLP